jgi:hypothetical protein
MITLFSGPKPFAGHIGLIQDNAVASWTRLGAGVEVLLLGDEPGIAEAAARHGARHLPGILRTAAGTPRLDSMFADARKAAAHPLLCYVNADVILLPDLLVRAQAAAARFATFLMVGQRWDLDLRQPLVFDEAWETRLRHEVRARGRRHPPGGSDYFVFPRGCFEGMPGFALGRAGWDNWMIYHARLRRWPVIDASQAVTAIHQDHDYAHLPGGRPHYRHPESDTNLELAGGRPAIFTLADSDWVDDEAGLRRRPLRLRELLRRIEASVYLGLGPGKAARRARLLLHPLETLSYLLHRALREAM